MLYAFSWCVCFGIKRPRCSDPPGGGRKRPPARIPIPNYSKDMPYFALYLSGGLPRGVVWMRVLKQLARLVAKGIVGSATFSFGLGGAEGAATVVGSRRSVMPTGRCSVRFSVKNIPHTLSSTTHLSFVFLLVVWISLLVGSQRLFELPTSPP